VFINDNVFNFSTLTKNVYSISLYKDYNFIDFVLLNNFLKKKKIRLNTKIYLFMLFFNKTCVHIKYLKLTQTKKQKLLVLTKNFLDIKIQTTKILIKYTKLFIVSKYNNFFLIKNGVNNINVMSSNIKNIKLNNSSIYKNINFFDFITTEFQFLRKNKVYNKGRYSRCRQNYRTGVYLCMYLSVVSIFGLYYWFFKFSFNFSYLWWFFIGFLGSFLLPKVIKYRLYEPSNIIKTFYGFFIWLSLLFKSFKG
jgi:hypothetical protein